MRTVLISALALFCLPLNVACKKQDSSPPAPAPAPTYQAGYPPPQAAYPAPQPTYQQQYPPPAPAPSGPYAPAPAPAMQPTPQTAPGPAPTPSASAAMAVPGPLAFQCQNDVPCGTHHCNLSYGKCAFPCQSNVDCLAPNSCVLGLCVPSYSPPK